MTAADAFKERAQALQRCTRKPMLADQAWETLVARGLIAPDFYDPDLRVVRCVEADTLPTDPMLVRAICARPEAVVTAEAHIAALIAKHEKTPRPVRFEWHPENYLPYAMMSGPKLPNASEFNCAFDLEVQIAKVETRNEIKGALGRAFPVTAPEFFEVLRLGFCWYDVVDYNPERHPASFEGCRVALIACPRPTMGPAGLFADEPLSMFGFGTAECRAFSRYDIRHPRDVWRTKATLLPSPYVLLKKAFDAVGLEMPPRVKSETLEDPARA